LAGSPEATCSSLAAIGEGYHEFRYGVMVARQEGLTRTYNRFHDPVEKSSDIAQLRTLQMEMDQAVAAAYGWGDLDLGHDFHQTRQGLRYTMTESARHTVLGRLLMLNHERYEIEVKAGLQNKKAKKSRTRPECESKSKETSPALWNSLFE
jgi:hypothetical protein